MERATYESRQPNVRTVRAAEGVAEVAAAARARLALDGEVELVEVFGFQLEGVQLAVGLGAARLVLGLHPCCEAACAVGEKRG